MALRLLAPSASLSALSIVTEAWCIVFGFARKGWPKIPSSSLRVYLFLLDTDKTLSLIGETLPHLAFSGRFGQAVICYEPQMSFRPSTAFQLHPVSNVASPTMAALSPAGQDRLLMLGIGLSTVAIIGLMRRMLISYRDEAVIPASENKSQYITQDVEDSLKLSTLDKLLDSPNYCIQETTAIIICERALHDKATIDALLYYITRPDHDMREKGIRALTMMMNSCKSLG